MKFKLIKLEDEFYLYQRKLAKDGDICVVPHNKLFYAYSSKDPGDGVANVVLASTTQVTTAHRGGRKELPLIYNYQLVELWANKKQNVKDLANKFIKDCNVFGFVSANEGGVINLNELLCDFIKYKAESDKEDENKFTLQNITDAIRFGQSLGKPVDDEDFDYNKKAISDYMAELSTWVVEIELEEICVQTGVQCGMPCNGECEKTPKLTKGYINILNIKSNEN